MQECQQAAFACCPAAQKLEYGNSDNLGMVNPHQHEQRSAPRDATETELCRTRTSGGKVGKRPIAGRHAPLCVKCLSARIQPRDSISMNKAEVVLFGEM